MNKKMKKILSIASASALAVSISCSAVPETISFPVPSATVNVYAAETVSSVSDTSHYSDEQQKLLTTALSLKGKIRYTWGGKATSTGWNAQWSRGTGLDCSGFVQWSFWTALGIRNGLGSTAEISGSFPSISKSQLRPGDLGLMFDGGSGYKDSNGKTHESKEAAQSANTSIAAQKVNAWLSGSGGSVHATAACERAKSALEKYQKAKEESAEVTADPDALNKKAETAEAKAKKLESEASAAEESAAAYSAQIRTLKGSSLQAYSSVSAEEETGNDGSGSAPEEDSSSSESESGSTDTEEKENTEKQETKTSGSSGNSSSAKTSTRSSGSSSGSEQPSTSKAERIREYEAKVSELNAKASDLRKEAESLRNSAKKDREAAEKAEKASKEDKTSAKENLKELKAAAAEAREKAVQAEAASYKTSQNANHVGIYVGKDASGNDLWVHCNSTNNTVSVNNFGGFHYFVRVIKNNHYTAKSEQTTYTDIVNKSKELAENFEKTSNFDSSLLKRELFLGPVVNKAEEKLMEPAREIRSHVVYRNGSDDSAAKG